MWLSGRMLVFVNSGVFMVFELMTGRLVARWIGVSCHTWVGLMATVLAGCTVGNLMADALVRRYPPQRILGAVFLLNAVCIVLVPWLNNMVGRVWSPYELGPVAGALGQMIPLTFLPAVLFGVVTPCVLATTVKGEKAGRGLGLVYLAGMAGCTAGSLAGGMWLPGWFRVSTVFWGMGGVLAGCAILTWLLKKHWEGAVNPIMREAREGLWNREVARRAGLVVATGFVAMAAEMAAAKQAAPLLGASHYMWSVLFAVFILGMGLGGWCAGSASDRWNREHVFTWGLVLAALAIYPYGLWMNSCLGLGTRWLLRLSAGVQVPLHIAGAFLPMAFFTGFVSTAAVRCALARADGGFDRGRAGFYWALAGLGNVAGTLCAGFFLLGVVRSSVMMLACAALLAALAWWRVAGGTVRDPNARAGSAVLAVVLVCLTLYGLRLGNREELPKWIQPPNTLSVSKVLYDRESRYNRVLVYHEANKPHVLTLGLDRTPHSSVDILETSRIYSVYVQMLAGAVEAFYPEKNPLETLIIGGGGFVLPQWLSETRPGSGIEVAEIDPVVTGAARAFLRLDKVQNMEVYDRDGRHVVDSLLRKGRAGLYDVVVGDTIADTAVPYHLVTLEMNAKVKQLMKPDGLYLLHLLDRPDRGRLVGSALSTLEKHFQHVAVLRWAGIPDGRGSHILLATDRPLDTPFWETTVRRLFPNFEGALLSPDELAMLAARPGVTLLRDDYVPVEHFILQDILDNDHYLRYLDLKWAEQEWQREPLNVFNHMTALASRKSTLTWMELELLRRSAAKLNRLRELLPLFASNAAVPTGVMDAKTVYARVLEDLQEWASAAEVYLSIARLNPDIEAFWGQAMDNALRAGQEDVANEIYENSLVYLPNNAFLRAKLKKE